MDLLYNNISRYLRVLKWRPIINILKVISKENTHYYSIHCKNPATVVKMTIFASVTSPPIAHPPPPTPAMCASGLLAATLQMQYYLQYTVSNQIIYIIYLNKEPNAIHNTQLIYKEELRGDLQCCILIQ